MKMILNFFKAPFSLGWLGLIIILMAGAMLMAIDNQTITFTPFDAVLERMDVLDTLENDVTYDLSEMQFQEFDEIFSLKNEQEQTENSTRKAQEADERIGAALKTLEEEGAFSADMDYGVDLDAELKTFNDLRATHRQTFDKIVIAYQAGDKDQAVSLTNQLEEENGALKEALNELIVWVEQGRLAALKEFPEVASLAVRYATIGLALLLILALIGYQVIAASIRPLHDLRNAITAIGGDRYRLEIQANALKKGGPAGALARALNQLAQNLQQQNAGLTAETERLRAELYASRRRRLKIYHPTAKGEPQS
jgi:sensor histidine kinase YesM